MVDPTSCADLADALAEVATGAASGPDRAKVLSHLSSCDDCRRELDELTRVADEVLLVAPEHEPPAGFEGAVLARIAELAELEPDDDDAAHGNAAAGLSPVTGTEDEPTRSAELRRHRALRYLALAAAALAIGLLGAGTVWLATSDERELAAGYRDTLDIADGRYFAAAPLNDASGAQVGHVFLYQGEPSWVFAVLGDAPAPGPYDVVVNTGTDTQVVATCNAEAVTCGAGATIDASIYQITEVQLVSPAGQTVTATLPWGSSD